MRLQCAQLHRSAGTKHVNGFFVVTVLVLITFMHTNELSQINSKSGPILFKNQGLVMPRAHWTVTFSECRGCWWIKCKFSGAQKRRFFLFIVLVCLDFLCFLFLLLPINLKCPPIWELCYDLKQHHADQRWTCTLNNNCLCFLCWLQVLLLFGNQTWTKFFADCLLRVFLFTLKNSFNFS